MTRLALTLTIFLVGCNTSTGDTDTDVNDTGTPPVPVDGCITNTNGDSFTSMQAALDEAEAGDTLELCEGAITDAVVITKDITIVGAGSRKTTWAVTTDAEGNAINAEANIITQGGVTLTISGITLESTRSGLRAEGGTVNGDDLTFKSPGTYGVYGASAAINLTNSTFRKADKGGVYVEGGSLSIENSVFDRVYAFGIKAEDNAITTVSNSEFTETRSKSGTDGYGIWLESGASLFSESNTYTDSYQSAINAESGLSFSMSNDAIIGGDSGILLENTTGTITDVSIEGIFKFGINTDSSGTLDIQNVDIITDPETSRQSTSGYDGSVGIYSVDTNLAVNGAVISGNNGYGIFAVKQYVTTMSVELTNVDLDNNARLTLQLEGVDAVLTDVSISNTRNDDTCITTDGQYWCNFAVRSYDANLVWDGGVLQDNEMYGLVSFVGAATLSNLEVRNNGTFGVYVQEGALALTDSEFHDGKVGSVAIYSGSFADLDNVNFYNGKYTSEYESTDGVNTTLTVYHHQGQDIVASNATVSISNAGFYGGDKSVQSYDSELTITDSEWNEYNENAVYAYSSTGTIASIKRSTINGVGAYALYCNAGAMELERVTITNMHEREYWYESYENGVLQSQSISSYSSPAIYGSYCDLTADEVTIKNSPDQAIYSYNSSANLTDITIANVNQSTYYYEGAIDLYNYSVEPNFFLKGIDIADVAVGNAIRIEGNLAYPGGNVELSDLNLGVGNALSTETAIGNSALYLDTLDTVSVTGFRIENSGEEGIVFDATTATVIGKSNGYAGKILSPGSDGIYLWNGSDITLSDVTIKNAVTYGVESQLSNLDATGLTVDGSGDSCLLLNQGVFSFDASSEFIGCADYGMECLTGPIIDPCPTTLSGVNGEQLGCTECDGS
jgi:hypothetical protein